MTDPTFDAATMTVADDAGGRLSVWDIDSCPKCDGTLVRSYAAETGGPDVMFCINSLGFETATCDVNVQRAAVTG